MNKMDRITIQKYKGRSVAWLLKKAQFHFNAFIRLRDVGKPCISCGAFNTAHASHFYSQGHYPTLRFNEFNVHASCMRCNTYLHGNLNEYRKRLPERIGIDKLNNLDIWADADKRSRHKWNRLELIEILERYKQKCKEFN